MVSRVRVFVATTEGPSEIQHIIEEDPDVRSVICLNGTSEALPVSRDYDSFVRKPTGIVERLFGHPSYRVDVSRRISNGQSWQLGVLIAHAFLSEGRLASKNETADEVYWVSGEVRHNLDVMSVDHIRDKLRQSEELFDGLERLNTTLTIIVPNANLDEADAEFRSLGNNRQDVILKGIAHWDEFETGSNSAPSTPARNSWRRIVFLLLATLVPLTAAAVGVSWWKEGHQNVTDLPLQPPLPPTKPAIAHQVAEAVKPSEPAAPKADKAQADVPVPIFISAIEKRAPAGSGCGRLRLTGGSTVNSEIGLNQNGGFDTRSALGLCEVEFHVANPTHMPRTIWVYMHSSNDGTPPTATSQILSPETSFALKVIADPWSKGKPWSAILIVASDIADGTVLGDELASLEPDAVIPHLEMIGIKPKVMTYSAVAPESPRFK